MNINFFKFSWFVVATGISSIWAQCEADATVYLTDFLFTPNEFVISVGETVAFVNAEGTHNVDGTAEGNPVSFFLEETEGNIDGVCMGTVTFDVPGVYTFTSSVGVQPELGMTGTIIVDAETLCDVMLSFWGSGENQAMDAYSSAYAFQSYFGCSFFGQSGGFPGSNVNLEGLDEYTLFLPNDAAIEGLEGLMNLNSFDLLYFTEGMVAGLSYHIVPGVYLAEDLQDGTSLPTVEGQNIAVSVDGEGTVMLNGATVLHEDVEAFNGVIHVIDEVLVPAGYPSATTWDVIEQSPDHTFLEQALLAEGLKEALRGQPILNDNEPAEGPFTVFAPTDEAFYAFAEANGFANLDELLNSQFIDDIVRAHLVGAEYLSGNLTNSSVLSSYNGQPINVGVEGENITANTAAVVEPDVLAYNGVIHVLGEVMPFAFPDAEGTCGAWTIVMNSSPSDFGVGWQGSSLHVYADGEEIASETMTSNGTESFSVPVDAGSRIDVVYNDVGFDNYHGFSVFDASGQELFSSAQPPMSVYGLVPCDEGESCGLLEITFVDDFGYGWYGGEMIVYSEEGVQANIQFNPDFDGDGYWDDRPFSSKKAVTPAYPGEMDFVVVSPLVYAEQCSYTVQNPEGEVVVNQLISNQAPVSSYDVELCQEPPVSFLGGNVGVNELTIAPNPAKSRIHLQGVPPDQTWTWSVFGTDGKLLMTRIGVGSQNVVLDELKPGLYIAQIQFEGMASQRLRFVKE